MSPPSERMARQERKLLEMYINRVNFGRGYYGIRAAALGFFGKEPEDLSVFLRCASIVCLRQEPGLDQPHRQSRA